MLEKISIRNDIQLPKISDIKNTVSSHKPFETPLTDSFVKSTAEIAPPLLGVVAAESFINTRSSNAAFKQAFGNDLKRIFLPMLLVISGTSAIYDDYKKNEQN